MLMTITSESLPRLYRRIMTRAPFCGARKFGSGFSSPPKEKDPSASFKDRPALLSKKFCGFGVGEHTSPVQKMNMQTCNRALSAIKAVSSQSSCRLCRHTHTIAPFSSPREAVSPSQKLSSRRSRAIILPAVRKIHAQEKRRLSSQSHAPVRDADRQWQPQQDLEAKNISKRHDGTPFTPYDHQSSRTKPQEEDDDSGIIVMSQRHHFRDKQGRPWTKEAKQGRSAFHSAGAAKGAAAGVGMSAPPARKQKPRTELRDLSVNPKKTREPWQAQKAALKKKFGDEGWNPRKKVSPDAMDGIRALHEQDPERWSTPVLAEHFKVSAEAIRRILKSKWRPKDEEGAEKRRERWAKRHDRIWDHQAELGLRPQRKKDRKVEDPDAFDEDIRAKEMLDIARKA